MLFFADFHTEFYSADPEKKLTMHQPDVTATSKPLVPSCYEYPFEAKHSMSRSISEHHYDVPHLSSLVASTESPTPSTPCRSISTGGSHSSSDKHMLSDSEHSLSSSNPSVPSVPSTESTYNVASGHVRLPLLETANVARARVGAKGALLVLPEAGISMSVPEGAVPKSSRAELHVAVLNDDPFRPQLPGQFIFIVYG